MLYNYKYMINPLIRLKYLCASLLLAIVVLSFITPALAVDSIIRTTPGDLNLTTITGTGGGILLNSRQTGIGLFVNTSNNVGIGTTSPSFNTGGGLNISRSTPATIRLDSTSGGSTGVEIFADGAGLTLQQMNGSRNFIFRGGNIALDNNKPLQWRNGADTAYTSPIVADTADNLRLQPSSGLVALFNGAGTEMWRFADTVFQSTATNILYVNQGAEKVGIGTASPGQKLSVAGTIESTSGGFKFPDGTTQATASSGSATMNASNVSSGAFGSNTGGGNYSFPSDVIINSGSDRQYYSRYNPGNNNYAGSLGWNSVQLGNNGSNYIIGGRTVAGGIT